MSLYLWIPGRITLKLDVSSESYGQDGIYFRQDMFVGLCEYNEGISGPVYSHASLNDGDMF